MVSVNILFIFFVIVAAYFVWSVEGTCMTREPTYEGMNLSEGEKQARLAHWRENNRMWCNTQKLVDAINQHNGK